MREREYTQQQHDQQENETPTPTYLACSKSVGVSICGGGRIVEEVTGGGEDRCVSMCGNGNKTEELLSVPCISSM
jgi:hypothetical protein